MSYFARKSNGYYPIPELAVAVDKELPLGTYTVKYDQENGFYLEPIDNFTLPPKLYGDLTKNTDRIINTFMSREGSTGVLLAGDKGSGKTLLAKNLSIELAKRYGMPTIIVGAAFSGEEFNTLIQGIQQPAMILFDEFEKIYRERDGDKKPQEGLLTLLDGTYSTRKLFVLTTNELWSVDKHMQNRPGRLFYLIKYKGLDKNFIKEYCEDNLKNPDRTNSVLNAAGMFYSFNFDLLKAMVEEMNRYDEDAKDALRILNAIPEAAGEQKFVPKLFVNDAEAPHDKFPQTEFYVDPFDEEEFSVEYYPFGVGAFQALQYGGERKTNWEKENGRRCPKLSEARKHFEMNPSLLKKADNFDGIFVYQFKDDDDNKYLLVLERKRVYSYDYYSAL